jgi:hypothetical protein
MDQRARRKKGPGRLPTAGPPPLTLSLGQALRHALLLAIGARGPDPLQRGPSGSYTAA